MRKIFSIIVLIATIVSCTEHPSNAVKSDSLPAIFPDYIGVTVPTEIAPLNFNIVSTDDIELVEVTAKGSKTGEMTANGDYAQFDIDEWHTLLSNNKGGKLTLTVSVKSGG